MQILSKPMLHLSSMMTVFLYRAKKSAHQGIPTPKLGGEEVAASRWDKPVDFNLVVRAGSECELNNSDSDYWAQHSMQPIAGSPLGCISREEDQALSSGREKSFTMGGLKLYSV